MKKLVTQSWEVCIEDGEKINIDFEKYSTETRMMISKNKMVISLAEEEVMELKNILEYTKFIFKK